MKTFGSRILVLFVIVSLTLSFLPAGMAQASQPHVAFWLTILHNNDGESDLIDLGSGLADFGGAARFKTLVNRLKWEAVYGTPAPAQPSARSVIMVSSGDNFLAGPEFNASLEKGVPFYDTLAMDMIGYDAVALGNHDFDFGPDVLADFISGYQRTRPPYLSANLDFSREPRLQAFVNQKRIAASTTVKTPAGRVGIIGATTPMLPFISSPRNVRVNDMVVEAIMREVQRLQAMNINKIILISHLQSINEDLDMVPYLSGIDVIIAGGGDEVLANPGHLLVPGDESRIFGPYPLWATDASGVQVPVVTTAGSYAYVGRLIAGFDKAGNLIRIDERSGPVRVAGGNQPDAVPADPEVQALVVEPLIAALDEMDNNVIATSEVPLDGLRVNVRSRETNLGSLAADALRWQASQLAGVYGVPVPQVAFQNGGGIRNNTVLPPGNLTELDTFSVLPFANFVSVVQGVTREQFKEILENAVSRVERGDGRFAQISGFRFTWNPAGTAQVLDADGNVTTVGSRVVNATLDDGTVIIADGSVVPGPALTVATIDFLARGGDQYPFRGAPFTTVGVTYQQALQNYLQSGLGGLVTAAQYPDGGAGRITRLP